MSDHFWSKVLKGDGCWEWQAGCTSRGYGAYYPTGYKQVPAHRYAYEQANGPIPDGMVICHKCDNKRCVRPDHLFVGTIADNVHDMLQKQRHKYLGKAGEQHHLTTLTQAQVEDIRKRRASGVKGIELAAEYGVTPATISNIYHAKTWAKEESIG